MLTNLRVTLGVDEINNVFAFQEVLETKSPGIFRPQDVALAATGEVGGGIYGPESFRKLGVK